MKAKKTCVYFKTCGTAENCHKCTGYERIVWRTPDEMEAERQRVAEQIDLGAPMRESMRQFQRCL